MNIVKSSAFVSLFLLSLLSFGCGGTPATDALSKPDSTPTGRIRGVVRLQGALPAAGFEVIAQDQQVCGKTVSLPRLALGKDGGVQHTFVYLDEVPNAQPAKPTKPVLVDQKECQYVPHMLVVPVGTKVEINNSDPILHNVHAHQNTDEGPQTLFNLAQPKPGQPTLVEAPLTKPGIISLSCEAGHPWMSGYVLVTEHPYGVVTNDDGEFEISGVPPGTYRIKMWHEGVIFKRNLKSLQRFEYEEPYEVVKEVVVQANAETVTNFDLALRTAK